MASNLLKLPIQTIKSPIPSCSSSLSTKTHRPSLPNPLQNQPKQSHISFFPPKPLHKSKFLCSSSLSTYSPPTSKEEAILQAKTCLSTTLEKPLNNPRLAGKLKKQKQPKFRIEIPVIDTTPESLTQLALDFFQDLPIKRKGTQLNILLVWPSSNLAELAKKASSNSLSSNSIQHMDISSFLTNDSFRTLNSTDVAVFLAPEDSELTVMKTVSDSLYPKPVVIFNPKWGFEDETSFGELSGFIGSFEVVYSCMGLEVRGVLSKRKGVVFKCARDGVLSSERWEIFVEEENGELKLLAKFKKRPSIGEVENVLYNLIAVNSPITKSAKFFRDLVANVTGNK